MTASCGGGGGSSAPADVAGPGRPLKISDGTSGESTPTVSLTRQEHSALLAMYDAGERDYALLARLGLYDPAHPPSLAGCISAGNEPQLCAPDLTLLQVAYALEVNEQAHAGWETAPQGLRRAQQGLTPPEGYEWVGGDLEPTEDAQYVNECDCRLAVARGPVVAAAPGQWSQSDNLENIWGEPIPAVEYQRLDPAPAEADAPVVKVAGAFDGIVGIGRGRYNVTPDWWPTSAIVKFQTDSTTRIGGANLGDPFSWSTLMLVTKPEPLEVFSNWTQADEWAHRAHGTHAYKWGAGPDSQGLGGGGSSWAGSVKLHDLEAGWNSNLAAIDQYVLVCLSERPEDCQGALALEAKSTWHAEMEVECREHALTYSTDMEHVNTSDSQVGDSVTAVASSVLSYSLFVEQRGLDAEGMEEVTFGRATCVASPSDGGWPQATQTTDEWSIWGTCARNRVGDPPITLAHVLDAVALVASIALGAPAVAEALGVSQTVATGAGAAVGYFGGSTGSDYIAWLASQSEDPQQSGGHLSGTEDFTISCTRQLPCVDGQRFHTVAEAHQLYGISQTGLFKGYVKDNGALKGSQAFFPRAVDDATPVTVCGRPARVRRADPDPLIDDDLVPDVGTEPDAGQTPDAGGENPVDPQGFDDNGCNPGTAQCIFDRDCPLGTVCTDGCQCSRAAGGVQLERIQGAVLGDTHLLILHNPGECDDPRCETLPNQIWPHTLGGGALNPEPATVDPGFVVIGLDQARSRAVAALESRDSPSAKQLALFDLSPSPRSIGNYRFRSDDLVLPTVAGNGVLVELRAVLDRRSQIGWSASPEAPLEFIEADGIVGHAAALGGEQLRFAYVVAGIEGNERIILHSDGDEPAVLFDGPIGARVAAMTPDQCGDPNFIVTLAGERTSYLRLSVDGETQPVEAASDAIVLGCGDWVVTASVLTLDFVEVSGPDQHYAIRTPGRVTGVQVTRTPEGVLLAWGTGSGSIGLQSVAIQD